jgi:hypothetical protein
MGWQNNITKRENKSFKRQHSPKYAMREGTKKVVGTSHVEYWIKIKSNQP